MTSGRVSVSTKDDVIDLTVSSAIRKSRANYKIPIRAIFISL